MIGAMRQITLIVVSRDRIVCLQWANVFREQGWEPVFAETLSMHGLGAVPGKSLCLVEIGGADRPSPEGLSGAVKKYSPGACLVFCKQEEIADREIAAYLEAGADDFFYKAIDERILVAKLKAHIRRLAPVLTGPVEKLASGDGTVEIDVGRRAVRVKSSQGKSVEISDLTPKELSVLCMLVEHESNVITREALLEELWGEGAVNVYSGCVDKHIESLRKKLGAYGRRIRTVYGSGYKFVDRSGI